MRKRWNANTWVVVILFTLIGLIGFDIGRQMLQAAAEKAEKAVPPSMDPTFKVGDKAPDFTLPDSKKKPVTFSKLVKGDTMLWFTCGCSNCLEMQEYMGKLSKQLGAKTPAIVNVTTMLPDREETWLRDTKLKQTILYENGQGPVGAQYKGHPCPRYFRVKGDQTVASIGDSPRMVPDMKLIASNLARELGFASPGAKPLDGQMAAPKMEFRESSPGPEAGSAGPGHSAGDGHNH
ncbi:MAG: redoxin domain-containing protein [Actinomycetota bacterium]